MAWRYGRALLLCLVTCAGLAGCAPDSGAEGDADLGEATSGPGGSSASGGGAASSNGSGAASSSATSSSTASTSTSTGSSSASSGGGSCKTECLGVECGLELPDDCGGFLDCGDCGPDADYCKKLEPPVFRDDVKTAIDATKLAHPEYFDLSDAMGESVKVLDLLAYRAAVVAHMVGAGINAIEDPNSAEELRVRGAADNAENYDIYTAAGYSSSKYTSTCYPAGF